MEIFIYAQLDENNICKAVSQLISRCDSPNMILLEDIDYDKLNRKYEDGIWGEKIYLDEKVNQNETHDFESIPYQPTNAEIAQLLTDLYSELIIAGVI